MSLTPLDGTYMGNPARSAFWIHGGNFDNYSSSQGCNILLAPDRVSIGTTFTGTLLVGK